MFEKREELKNGCGKDGGVAQWVVQGPGLGSQYPCKKLLVLACSHNPSTEEEVEKGRSLGFASQLVLHTHTHACMHSAP